MTAILVAILAGVSGAPGWLKRRPNGQGRFTPSYATTTTTRPGSDASGENEIGGKSIEDPPGCARRGGGQVLSRLPARSIWQQDLFGASGLNG